MLYRFNIVSTEKNLNTKEYDLDPKTSIKDLKILLVGPYINIIGLNKLKIIQQGVSLNDDDCVGKFNCTANILIFPTTPSLRTILINNFSNNDSSSDEEDKRHIRKHSILNGISSDDDEDEYIKPFADSEKPKLDFKSSEEIVTEINETINMFKKPCMIDLLNIYLKNKDSFIEFIEYLSKGQYQAVDPSFKMEYPIDLLNNIRTTFPLYHNKTNDELISILNTYGGNIDIMLNIDLANTLT